MSVCITRSIIHLIPQLWDMDKIRIQIRGCLAGRQLNTLFSMSRRYHRLKVTGHYSCLLCPLTFISYLYFYANQYLRKTASVGSHTFNNYVCMSVWSHSHLHVKQRHGQALLIHICPGHTISIQSRFLPLLRSIFQSFFYKFLCCFPPPPLSARKSFILWQIKDVSFSAFWTRASSISVFTF